LLEPGCAYIDDAGGDDSKDDMLFDTTILPFCTSIASIGAGNNGISNFSVELRCLELVTLIVIS
jgi:hypothetical protein